MRDATWTANAAIEVLEKSIQADVFHLYSLSEGTAYGSVLINYFITGAPSTEFKLRIPEGLENVVAEGKDLRGQKLEDGTLTVTLHQAVMGSFTLLVTFEENASETLAPGFVSPLDIQGESGYVQIVSPNQVTLNVTGASDSLLSLDHLELPPEFRLLSASPSLGIWQYNERPFDLAVNLSWLDPDRTLDQVVEFAEAVTLISRESESVTDLVYYVKSRDNRPFSIQLPDGAKIWDVRTNGRSVASRQTGDQTQIPLLLTQTSGNLAEVRMRLGNTVKSGKLRLPKASVPVLKTGWQIKSERHEVTKLKNNHRIASAPVLPPSGFHWIGNHGLLRLFGVVACVILGLGLRRRKHWIKWFSLAAFAGAVWLAVGTAILAFHQKVSPAPLIINVPVLSADEAIEVAVRSVPVKGIPFTGKGIFVLLAGVAALASGIWARVRLGSEGLARLLFVAGVVLLCFGILAFSNSAALFFGLIAAIVFVFFLFPDLVRWIRQLPKPKPRSKSKSQAAAGTGTALLLIFSGGFGFGQNAKEEFQSWDSLEETWTINHHEGRLHAKVTAKLSGEPGDQFFLLRAPAVLTELKADGLLLKKVKRKRHGDRLHSHFPGSRSVRRGGRKFRSNACSFFFLSSRDR